jgi:hypothetical protein
MSPSKFPRNAIRWLENTNSPLLTLVAVRSVRDHLDLVEAWAIRRAHEQGASLADIAAALGMSRQGVHYRLHHAPEEKSPDLLDLSETEVGQKPLP